MRNREIELAISIIIPAKNEEKSIQKCLEAVAGIAYPKEKIEVIVVDNGSSDKTVEIARGCGAKVLVDPTGTISALRNLGASKAEGEILGFIDADIVVGETWLTGAVHYFKNKEIACVGSSPGIPKDSTWVERAKYLKVVSQPNVWDAKWIASMNLLIRKEVFWAVNGFDENLVTCEDVDLGYRVGRLKHCGRIIRDKAIVAVHLGEAKTLSHLFRKERWRATSNYSGAMAHGIVLQEIPSLLTPLVNLAALIAGMMYLAVGNPMISLVCLSVICIFPIVSTSIVIWRTRFFIRTPQVFLVQLTYTFAKIVATLDYGMSLLKLTKAR